MGVFDLIFGSKNEFVPDYRDVILYNGYIPFRATGRFEDNLIEFEQYNNPDNKILFNTNLSKKQYIEYHEKYNLFRFLDGTSFLKAYVKTSTGIYCPTGRVFYSEEGQKTEFMKKDNPNDVCYLELFFPVEQLILGKKCLEIPIKTENEKNINIFENKKEGSFNDELNLQNALPNILQEYAKCKSEVELKNIVDRYISKYNDSVFYYQAGIWYWNNKINMENAKIYFLAAIDIGTIKFKKYLNSLHNESVGGSIVSLLTKYKNYDYTDNEIIKLTKLGYCSLTNFINIENSKHDYCFIYRAELLEHRMGNSILPMDLSGCIPFVFSLSDYYYASKGFQKNFMEDEAKYCYSKAKYLHNFLEDISVAGKDVDEYELSEIAEIGKSRHISLYNFFNESYLNGGFQVSIKRLSELFDKAKPIT